jgi:hypothetical protein
MEHRTLPDLRALVDPLLGAPYAQYTCWHLVRHLVRAGWGWDMAAEPERAASAFRELWYRGDPADPLSLVTPWDIVICSGLPHLPVSTHVGLALDAQAFVHARDQGVGVVIEPLRRWRPKLLQLARLRSLDLWQP